MNDSDWHCSLFWLALLWMIPTGTVHYSDWHFSWWFRLALFMMIPAGAVQDDSALSLFRMIPPCRCSGWFRLSLFRMIPTVAVKDDSNCRYSGWFRLSLFMVILTVTVQDDSDCHCEECSRSSADSNSSTVVRILLFIFHLWKGSTCFYVYNLQTMLVTI